MKLFSGTSNLQLAEKIAEQLNISVSPVDIHIFPDGEKRVRVTEKVDGEHCIVVQPTNTPADSNYMELFFLVDSLKRSGAEFVTAVVPYLGYQRQDHVFRSGEAVSLEVIIKTLNSVGLDSILSIDLHSIRIPDVFTIPMHHLSALPLFAEKIRVILSDNEGSSQKSSQEKYSSLRQTQGKLAQNDKGNNTVLVSPDMGGISRIKKLSELLGNMPYAAIEKNRDLQTGRVTAKNIGEGSVSGKKRAIIIDDMIASGKTIITAANVLLSEGVEEIYVFATHAIFSEDAPSILERSVVRKFFVTDSVFIPKEKLFDRLEVLSVAGIIAKEIMKGK